jgi:hypothetical protein
VSPFTSPTRRAKKVLEQRSTTSEVAGTSAQAIQDFLDTQQATEGVDGGGLEDPGESSEIDQAQFEHDTLVVQDMVFQAIKQLSALKMASPTTTQLRGAQGIMPAVSGIKV